MSNVVRECKAWAGKLLQDSDHGYGSSEPSFKASLRKKTKRKPNVFGKMLHKRLSLASSEGLALVFCLAGARLVPSSGSQFFQAAVQDHSPVDLRLNFWSWGTLHGSWVMMAIQVCWEASSPFLSIFVIRTWLNGCMVGWKDVEGLNRPIFWWPAYTFFLIFPEVYWAGKGSVAIDLLCRIVWSVNSRWLILELEHICTFGKP